MKLFLSIFAAIFLASFVNGESFVREVKKRIDLPGDLPRRMAAKLISMDEKMINAQVNEYTDILMANVDQYIIEQGLEPMPGPEIHLNFSYQPIIINYHGELDMVNGFIRDISTLHRGGDALISYEMFILNMRIPLKFRDIKFDYDYSAELMGLGPHGQVHGTIDDIIIYVDVSFDLKLMEIVLQEFRIDSAGRININFDGHDLYDWFLELLMDLTTTVLHDTVLGMVEGGVAGVAQDLVVWGNGLLNSIFNQ